MNKIISTIIGFIFFGSIASAQLTEFSQGDILSAGAMNQNFKYLEDRIAGINETTVDCGTDGEGSGINEAIRKGFNSIVIKGICKENIGFDGTRGNSFGLLKLRGANNDSSLDKIVDNSSYSDHVLKFNYGGMLVTIDNLTISGGDRGITTWMNIGIRIRNSKIEGYKNRGLTIQGSSVLEAENLVIDGSYSGASSEEQGLRMWGESNAYIDNLTVSNNQKYGITLWLSSIETNGILNLSNNSRAINVGKGASFTTKSKINISGSNNRAINVFQGIYEGWDGTLNVTNTSGAIFRASQAKVLIKHLEAAGKETNDAELVRFGQSSCDLYNIELSNSVKTALQFYNSVCYIENVQINNSKDVGLSSDKNSDITVRNGSFTNNKDGLRAWNLSSLDLDNVTVTKNSDDGLEIGGNSFLNLKNSTVSENNDKGIGGYNSMIRIDNSKLTSNKDDGIQASDSSIEVRYSTISSNQDEGIDISRNSGLELRHSVISENTENGIDIRRNSYTRVDNSTIKNNFENGISLSRNSYLDLSGSVISNNKKDGVNIDKNSILDFSNDINEPSTTIESNGEDGVDASNQVIIEFDGGPVNIKNNTGKQIQFGVNTETYIPNSSLNTTSIDCWHRSSQDPNDSSKTLNSGYPLIGFENKSGFSGTISSNCRVY